MIFHALVFSTLLALSTAQAADLNCQERGQELGLSATFKQLESTGLSVSITDPSNFTSQNPYNGTCVQDVVDSEVSYTCEVPGEGASGYTVKLFFYDNNTKISLITASNIDRVAVLPCLLPNIKEAQMIGRGD